MPFPNVIGTEEGKEGSKDVKERRKEVKERRKGKEGKVLARTGTHAL
jgi:hypothetical protein